MSAPLLTTTVRDYQALAWSVLVPPQAQDLWTWWRRHLVMPEGGRWDPRRAGLVRRAVRVIQARLSLTTWPADPLAHQVEEVWLVFAAQLAKTALLHAILLAVPANHPRKVGFYMNRLQDLKTTRSTKVERQLMAIRPLVDLLPTGEAALTQALAKETWIVGTAIILWLCGSVYDDCRAHDLDLALLDEFDRYQLKPGEGNPLAHIKVRQRAKRAIRLLVGGSTPSTIDGPAWRKLCEGTHERLLIECRSCRGVHWPDWRQLRVVEGEIEDAKPSEIIVQGLARWVCPHCGDRHDAAAFERMIREAITAERWCPGKWRITREDPGGEWTAAAELDPDGRLVRIHPPAGTVRSQHASSLCSLDETIDTFLAKMVDALKGTPDDRLTWTNNEAAEPWLARVIETSTDELEMGARPATAYASGQAPEPGDYLFVIFDQQENDWSIAWFPWEVILVRQAGPAWTVAAGTAKDHAERDQVEARDWLIGGQPRKVDAAWMDGANGNVRFDIFLWAAGDCDRRFIVRGDPKLADGVPWKEVIESGGKHRRMARPAGVREWRVHPSHWRTHLWKRLRRVEGHQPWYWPTDLPAEVKASHTSQEQVVEKVRVPGVGYRDAVVWRDRAVVSTAGGTSYRTDQHWWDCSADACAVISILGLDRLPPDDTGPTADEQLRALVDQLGRRR